MHNQGIQRRCLGKPLQCMFRPNLRLPQAVFHHRTCSMQCPLCSRQMLVRSFRHLRNNCPNRRPNRVHERRNQCHLSRPSPPRPGTWTPPPCLGPKKWSRSSRGCMRNQLQLHCSNLQCRRLLECSFHSMSQNIHSNHSLPKPTRPKCSHLRIHKYQDSLLRMSNGYYFLCNPRYLLA